MTRNKHVEGQSKEVLRIWKCREFKTCQCREPFNVRVVQITIPTLTAPDCLLINWTIMMEGALINSL